jgi:ATP-binding cassette subfamily B multidrug efflux pump
MAIFNSAAMAAVIGLTLWVWSIGVLSVRQVEVAIALALRLNTITGWNMWMTVRTFEHVGTISKSLESISESQIVTDKAESAHWS